MKQDIPTRVADFVRSKKPARLDNGYCDDCIAKALGLGSGQNQTMAHNVTSALAQAPMEFDRGKRRCDGCQKEKLVIRAV
jgi:hypothetical protein